MKISVRVQLLIFVSFRAAWNNNINVKHFDRLTIENEEIET